MAIRGSGELKVQFYAHLDEIRDLYFNQGFVVFKILHKEIVSKYGLSLDYQAFCYYARKELKKENNENNEKREHYDSKENNQGDRTVASPSFSDAGVQTSLGNEPKVATINLSNASTKIKKNTRAKRESIGE